MVEPNLVKGSNPGGVVAGRGEREPSGADKLPETLTEAITSLADSSEAGFTFYRSTTEKHYLSFAALHAEAVRMAQLLQRCALSKGDRVALALMSEDEIAVAFLGAVLAGLIPVVINPRSASKPASDCPSPLEAIVRSCHARIILTSSNFLDLLAPLQQDSEFAAQIRCIDHVPSDKAASTNPSEFVAVKATPDDLCFLQYTSGTTRIPHGVMITHRNLMTNASACLRTTRSDGNLVHHAVSWLPLHHDFGLIGFFLAPIIGQVSTTFFSPSLFARRPLFWLELLHGTRASTTGAPNFALSFTRRRLESIDLRRFDLSGLGVMFCGGEPIQYETLRAFAEWLAPTGFDGRCYVPSYGLAEATLAVTLHPARSPVIVDRLSQARFHEGRAEPAHRGEKAIILVSCGPPIPGLELEIVKSNGTIVQRRTIGEIRIRGATVSPGYLADSVETEISWRDGWLYTGDLGYFADGNLFVCGRLRDLIIVRGINHYPQDIESTVERMSEFRGRIIGAFATTRDGEEGVTVIVECRINQTHRSPALCAAIGSAIVREHGMMPHDIRLVPPGSLPLTSSGKIQRSLAKNMYEAGRFDDDLASEPAKSGS
jgi:fatty-acyl-CoA synthase